MGYYWFKPAYGTRAFRADDVVARSLSFCCVGRGTNLEIGKVRLVFLETWPPVAVNGNHHRGKERCRRMLKLSWVVTTFGSFCRGILNGLVLLSFDVAVVVVVLAVLVMVYVANHSRRVANHSRGRISSALFRHCDNDLGPFYENTKQRCPRVPLRSLGSREHNCRCFWSVKCCWKCAFVSQHSARAEVTCFARAAQSCYSVSGDWRVAGTSFNISQGERVVLGWQHSTIRLESLRVQSALTTAKPCTQ
jgi:hypothetical protein